MAITKATQNVIEGITSTGSTTARTLQDRFADVVNVKDFGAVGDGVADDTAAIQAVIDASIGSIIFFPKGDYKITSSINLKSQTNIKGSGRESTRIIASGNYPILQHIGSLSNTVGDVSIQSIQIRGQSNTNNKQFGVFCDWGGTWLIEDCSFRLCNIGYFQGTSRNNVVTNCDFISCNTSIWMGPIDQSGGGTPDNTIFLDTIDSVATVTTGFRIEGCTGLKAVNCSFVDGQRGVYFGDYNQSLTPRAILDGSTINVPSPANARNIAFLHLSNIYTDTTSAEGWIIKDVTTGTNTKDVRIVNCWSGNSNSANQSIKLENIDRVQVSASSIVNSNSCSLVINACTDVNISNIVTSDWDRTDNAAPSVVIANSQNATIVGISGDCPNSTQQQNAYLVSIDSCERVSASNLISTSSGIAKINDSLNTSISNSKTNNATIACVTELGTTNITTLIDVKGGIAPNIIGANSLLVQSGTTSAPRTTIRGGSNSQPSLYLDGASNSGFYREGTYGISYSLNGVKAFQLFDNSGTPATIPGTDNTQSLGVAARRWSQLFAGTSVINTSDEREKQDIENLNEAEKRVAISLKLLVKKFRFKDAVSAKGENARIHVGVIAQEVVAAFESEGLDATKYGLLCYDEWDEQSEEKDSEGNVIQEYRSAGNRYGIRYDQLLAFIISAI